MAFKKNYCIVICLLISFAPVRDFAQSRKSLFNDIYESEMKYFKDSLDSYSVYKQIVDFGRKSRQKFYEAHNMNIDKSKNYIILEGNSGIGAVYTGILFDDDKEIAYTHSPAKGWQVSVFKKSEFDSLSNFTGIDLVMIKTVSAWNIDYINKLKHKVGGTGVADGYSFIASRIDNKQNRPVIETIGFEEFNILY